MKTPPFMHTLPAGEAAVQSETGRAAAPRPGLLLDWWRTRTPREHKGLQLAGWVLAAASLWLLLVAPAWRTLQSAGAERAQLDALTAEMQALADEAKRLQAVPALAPSQAAAALDTTVAKLGPKARMSLQGDRAVLTLQGLSMDELGPWLHELGTSARARPLQLNLTREAAGYSGNLVLAMPTRP